MRKGHVTPPAKGTSHFPEGACHNRPSRTPRPKISYPFSSSRTLPLGPVDGADKKGKLPPEYPPGYHIIAKQSPGKKKASYPQSYPLDSPTMLHYPLWTVTPYGHTLRKRHPEKGTPHLTHSTTCPPPHFRYTLQHDPPLTISDTHYSRTRPPPHLTHTTAGPAPPISDTHYNMTPPHT